MTDDQLDKELARTLGDPEAHAFRELVRDVDAEWEAPVKQLGERSASAKTEVTAPRQAKQRRMPMRRILAMAASVLLLAVVGYWSLSGPSGSVDDYLTPYEVSFAVRSAGDGNASSLRTAQDAYQAGEYSLAAERFGALPSDASTDFYRGVSLLLTKEPAKVQQAEVLLGQLAQRNDHLYQEQAHWYHALSLLQLGKSAQAEALLQEIEVGAYRYAEAQEVLDLIE